MKALITGGGGFIGLHLAGHLLDNGWQVDLIESFARAVEDEDLARTRQRPGARLIRRDARAAAAFEDLDRDYDCIFHLAAIVGVANVLKRPRAVLEDNVVLLARALEFAGGQKALRRFLFASTSEVYAGLLQFSLPLPTPEDIPLAVTDLAHPRTTYMLSKIYGEALCRHGGVPYTIFRPHNVYGPRMGLSHVIPELMGRAHAGKDGGDLEVASVEHRRTFCYVADAVEMIRRAAEAPACAGEAINVGSQRPEVAIGDLARTLLRVVGRDMRIVALPPTPGSPARRCPDMSKTARLTGYAARVGLEEGLTRTWEWYRSRVFETGGPSAV